MLQKGNIHNGAELSAYVDKVGFLPLLDMGIADWSAESAVDEDCQYLKLPDGGWEWPLWEWKGAIIQESGCAYGKFFRGKAGFICRTWWPHFCNWRRQRIPTPTTGSIEEAVLLTLQEHGSLITRELRAACGFNGTKMRSRFDTYLTSLEMGGRIVTEDFVYPHDKHGRQYGWGWSLLTTPERLFGRKACIPDCTPQQSYEFMLAHFRTLLPHVPISALQQLLGRPSL